MLDITQFDYSPSIPGAIAVSKPESQGGIFPSTDSPVPLSVVNRPLIVTWRVTRSSNRRGSNCLPVGQPLGDPAELTTSEGLALLSDSAACGVSRLLLAGGEPLLRKDPLEFVAYQHKLLIQSSLLTNGTLRTRPRAAAMKCAGLHSVSFLLPGLGCEVDGRQGRLGDFNLALEGYANCEAAGPWMSDPACYLTDKEIGKEVTEPLEVMADDVLLSEMAA